MGDERTEREEREREEREVHNYLQLEFGTNKSGETELKLKGPEIPGTETSPVIVFHKKNGKYTFEIGVEIHEVDAGELSDDLRAFIAGSNRRDGTFGRLPLRMPSKDRLIRTTDGTFKSFSDFKRDTWSGFDTRNVRKNSFKTPIIPEPLYWELVRFYRTHDKFGNPLFL